MAHPARGGLGAGGGGAGGEDLHDDFGLELEKHEWVWID
jgi:hypothetical protein